MDCLKSSKENRYTDYHKNHGIIYDVFLCAWVMKRRERFHEITMLNLEFKNSLPILEICDQSNDLFVYLFYASLVSISILKKYLIEKWYVILYG